LELWKALEAFDRKERNLLIRFALGMKSERPALSETFCDKVEKKLGIQPTSRAWWWATDYHISWIAGALCVYRNGIGEALKPQPNIPRQMGDLPHLVEGNQEDIDLVVVAGEHLIMIEAKGYGAWSKRQMSSKLERLELLHSYYLSLGLENHRPISFHLLVTSPSEPKSLVPMWPSWACKEGQVPWIRLDLADRDLLFAVTRCEEDGQVTAAGNHWRVVDKN
jgi:hypothetical protein